MLQRRNIASGTYLITKQENFKQSAEIISKLTPNDIKIAIKQKQNKQLITNRAVFELLKNVNIVGERIMVMLYAREEIDINNLLPEEFPTATEKARLAYLDPTAVAKYFNNLIKNIIKFIFGYRKPEGRVLDSWSSDFNEKLHLDILRIAKCTLFYKLEAPGKIYPELGVIALQHRNAYINNHNPYINASCHGNNDIRFITAVKLALAYIHYITDYIMKSDIVGQTEVTGPQVSMYLLNFKDHYTPNKFVTIYLNSFETYLFSQYLNKNLFNLTYSESSDTNSNDNEPEQNEDSSKFADDEIFTIINLGNRVNTVNLCIDYMYCNEQLRNMCFYNYAATIHKIKINSKELDKLKRQKNRKGYATRVDQFLFLDEEKECNETCDHDTIHPQHSTHMQAHW
ncbi:1586_t:CDS:2 [Cetraspora pellucida]|uniref:1586_t:CDS:1 n=1 Tax=Cetraspora pellucida TaxID=1433469 RepID=A0A9N9NB84_9GLOM|nr:1586_t:CDS:2 [Cetraspora pellucida]